MGPGRSMSRTACPICRYGDQRVLAGAQQHRHISAILAGQAFAQVCGARHTGEAVPPSHGGRKRSLAQTTAQPLGGGRATSIPG